MGKLFPSPAVFLPHLNSSWRYQSGLRFSLFLFRKNVYRTKGQHFSIITPDGIWFSRLVILFSCSNTFENVIFNSKRTTFESIMEEKLQKNCVCVSVSPSSIDLFLLVCLSLVNANKIIRNLE